MLYASIREAADAIARAAQVITEMSGKRADEALDIVCDSMLRAAEDARTRRGTFARTTTSDEIENAYFIASVAADALAGTCRPSTGDVRRYILNAITS